MAKKKTIKKNAGPKKKPSTKKAASRKTASKATRTKARRPAARAAAPAGALKLSDLRKQIDRALQKIDTVAAREPGRYDETRARLARWADDIDDICNPDNPFGCGPIMVFPA